MRPVRACSFLLAIFLVGCASISIRRHESDRILGQDSVSPAQMERFLLRHNPGIDHAYARKVIAAYDQECRYEGVRVSVAFAQMCLETGYLTFGDVVSREQNNFCGYGAQKGVTHGESFPTLRAGVRAHVQHLKAYATAEPTRRRCVDGRRKWVKAGSAPRVTDLSGKWDLDPNYGEKLSDLVARVREA
jgi:hypothetical protein